MLLTHSEYHDLCNIRMLTDQASHLTFIEGTTYENMYTMMDEINKRSESLMSVLKEKCKEERKNEL